MAEVLQLKPGESLDQLGYQGLRIIQDPTKFKFTIDAFLLTAFINPRPGQRVLDLGCGSGVLALLIAGPRKVGTVVGLELQPELVDLARRNVALNQLQQKIRIYQGDLRQPPPELKPNSFDYVMANPPFHPVSRGLPSANPALAQAKFELSCTLEQMVRAGSQLVRGNGRVALVYPTARLGELLLVLNRHHLVPQRICLVYPWADALSHLVLVEARPGAKSGLKVLPPLVVSDSLGEYSPALERIFHGGLIGEDGSVE